MQLPDSTYVTYGTSYSCGFKLYIPSPYCGVRAYTSPDLAVWTDRGLMFDPTTAQPHCAPAEGAFGCYEPRVVRRPDGKYVMWVNAAGPTRWSFLTYTATNPVGPFTPTGVTPVLASPLWLGSEDIFTDAAGVGYVAYTVINLDDNNSHDIFIEELDPTYLTGTGKVYRFGMNPVEAPSVFQVGGWWYLTYSDPMCGYCGGTGTSYQRSQSPLGPWEAMGRISEFSCSGQPSNVSVITVAGTVVALYQSDRWQQVDGSYNPNQALAETHIEPLQFDTDGGILPLSC